MTNKRKLEMWDEILFWVSEVINDEKDLAYWCDMMGFTKEETESEFGIYVEDMDEREN